MDKLHIISCGDLENHDPHEWILKKKTHSSRFQCPGVHDGKETLK